MAKLYLHWFDVQVRQELRKRGICGEIIRYADDFVVLTPRPEPEFHEWMERLLEVRFELTVNREKSRVVDLKKEKRCLHFLGYTFVSASNTEIVVVPDFMKSSPQRNQFNVPRIEFES